MTGRRQKLERNDRLEFGARDSTYAIFNPAKASSNTAREFLSQISGIQISQEANDLEKLTLFLEAARKLNTAGVLDEILVTMLDETLRLTRAERAMSLSRMRKAICGWPRDAIAKAKRCWMTGLFPTPHSRNPCGRTRSFC